jgi:hypothetical protein
MAGGTGTATLNFGAFPGSQEASVSVSVPTVGASSKAEAFIMGDDSTADHSASDHRYIAALLGLTCGTPVAGVGFTIYGRALDQLSGQVAVRYVWTD